MKLLLLSGGLDSTALAYWLKPDIGVTVNYGQRAAQGEIRASKAIAHELSLPHTILTVDAAELGSGVMAGGPTTSPDTPPEAWPFRNQFLLTLVAMKFAPSAEEGSELIIGTVKGDRAHCDGRPEFVRNINETFGSQKPHFTVSAPALNLEAHDLLLKSKIPIELLGWTFSCHVAEVPCGECRGCLKHIETKTKYSSAMS